MVFEQVTIVGVGLIGGSVGLAVRERGVARRIVGVGRDEWTLSRAAVSGAIDTFTTDLASAVVASDLVVVCTPVDRVASDVLKVAETAPSHCVITDVGSTKGNIVEALGSAHAMRGVPYVGSHPLAGSEKRGSANARGDLFDDRVVVVTATADTDPEATSVVELFWRRLGARVIRMDPVEHDRALAVTSHLPHAAASALAGVTPPAWLSLTAGGFRDSTRIAAGDPDLWAAIFEANRDAVLDSLAQFQDRLSEFRLALDTGDRMTLVRWLTDGKRVRDALGS